MANQFPWEAYMQAVQQKNKNQQDMMNTLGGTLASLGQTGQQFLQERAKQHKAIKEQKDWESAIDQFAQQNPQYASIAPLLKKDKSSVGQLLPSVMKAQKPTEANVSVWRNNKTGDVSMSPQDGPDWMQESGLKPAQRQSILTSAESGKARKDWQQSFAERTEASVVGQLYNQLNSLDKSGVLGQAAQIQYRAQRGDHLLDTPGIARDKLVYGLVTSDLAAIAQGGSPTLAAQAESTLPTYKEMANGLLRKITAHPESIDQPEIRMQLRRIFQVMDKSAGAIVDQNTAGVRALWEDSNFAKNHPNAFKRAIQYLGQGVKPFDTSKLPPLGQEPATNSPNIQDFSPVDGQ